MKITVDSLGSSSGEDESRLEEVDIEGKGEDSDVELLEMDTEDPQVQHLIMTGRPDNWSGTDSYTNGRGGGGSSYRGSRGGNRMRGLGPRPSDGNGGGGGEGGWDRGNGEGYQGSFSPTHVSNLSSDYEDLEGFPVDNGQNGGGGGGGGDGGDGVDYELKETLTRLAANINSGFAHLNTAMEQLRKGQVELYDAKYNLEKLCQRHGVHPEFPAAEVMGMASNPFDCPVAAEEGGRGRGRGDVSARARKWHPRMRPSGGPKPCFKISESESVEQQTRKQVESSVYNSQLSKEGVTKLVKRLNGSLNMKGTKKRHAVVVLHDVGIGNREMKGATGNGSAKMEGDAKAKRKISELMEEDKQETEEEEEEYRPIRKKSKENLPHWRKLRVDPPVMERIMKRLREFNSASAAVTEIPPEPPCEIGTETICFDGDGVGGGGGEENIKEGKIGEEN